MQGQNPIFGFWVTGFSLTNYGVAFQKGLLGHCGKPFVAEYDRHTGKELSVTFPDIKNKLSGRRNGSRQNLLAGRQGLMYNNHGETEVHRIEWKAPVKKAEKAEEQDECYYWPEDTVYQYSEGRLNAMVTDAHQVFVESQCTGCISAQRRWHKANIQSGQHLLQGFGEYVFQQCREAQDIP